jgi:tRNA nucleotidyltransferase (CCA-adding enzyme)
VAWSVLRAEDWPVPISAFPDDAALVGGAVRDALLNRLGPAPDLDLVVAEGAIALSKTLSKRFGGSPVVLDAERDIGRLVIRGWSVDLARREGQSLADDLQRRDYSVNAMALPLAQRDQLVDPHGGLEHLQRRQLVALAERNLLDDPLRLLRGVRLASELEFELDDTTAGWIQRHRERLSSVAGERVLAELEKLCQSPQGQQGLQRCLDWGLLAPCPALAPLARFWMAQACSSSRAAASCNSGCSACAIGSSGWGPKTPRNTPRPSRKRSDCNSTATSAAICQPCCCTGPPQRPRPGCGAGKTLRTGFFIQERPSMVINCSRN